MCSNRSSGSYADLQDDYSGSCSKKQRKDKVRRRGPGVAELEKIRLQEENKSPPLSSSSSFDHTLFPPPPPPPKTSLYTTQPIFRPPLATATEKLPSPGFPFFSCFTNGSFPKDLIPLVPVFQWKQHSSLHPQTMNLSNLSPGPGEFHHFIEPPSNQNVSQEDKKMVNAKRPCHFLTDNTKAKVGPISRDVKQNRSLDMRWISPVHDAGTTICNPIAIDSPSSIRSFPRNYPRFLPLSLQYAQKEFDENITWRSKKPFYNFIPSDDQRNGDREIRACECDCERYESPTDHEIDLNLKL